MTKPKGMGGLGFRDIELFNLALLARQCWRLLQQPNSLGARILKARYHPNGNLLNSEVGNSPSQVWRGIYDGLGVLKQGLIRRIGNGKDTHVWNDSWIPRDGTMRPIYCRSNDAPTFVSEMIDRTNAVWIEDKLEQFFLPMDA